MLNTGGRGGLGCACVGGRRGGWSLGARTRGYSRFSKGRNESRTCVRWNALCRLVSVICIRVLLLARLGVGGVRESPVEYP